MDGVIMEKDFNLSSISLEQIERIDVLKEETAVAIYGEQGKNGVMIITMKSN